MSGSRKNTSTKNKSHSGRPEIGIGKKIVFTGLIIVFVIVVIEYVVFGPLNPNYDKYTSVRVKQAAELFAMPSEYGWELAPGLKWTDESGRVMLSTNSRGYRETAEVDTGKKPGEIRIFAANDSIQFGAEVAQGESICDVAEKLLDADSARRGETVTWNIINASVPCWGHYQTLWRIRNEGRQLNPDLYMLSVCQNDPGDDYMMYCAEQRDDPEVRARAREMLLGGPETVDRTKGSGAAGRIFAWLLHHTNTGRWKYWREQTRKAEAVPDWYSEMWNTISNVPQSYETVMIPVYLDILSALCDETGGRAFVIVYPAHNYVGHVLGKTPGRDYPVYYDHPVEREIPFRKATLDFLDSKAIPTIDVLPVYLDYLETHPDVDWQTLFAVKPHPQTGNMIPDKIHPSALGHRLAAEQLPGFLHAHFPELFERKN